jgi:hypothetical protein
LHYDVLLPFQFVLLALAAAVLALSSAFPQGGSHGDYQKLPPRPFHYAYGVKDEYAGTNFDKQESQDAYGNVEGSYRVALPDGRTQIVKYHADHENGFIADVSYEGKASYQPHSSGGGYKSHGPTPHHLL